MKRDWKAIQPEEELEVTRLFSAGKKAKEIAYSLKMDLQRVYYIRELLPLFCRKVD